MNKEAIEKLVEQLPEANLDWIMDKYCRHDWTGEFIMLFAIAIEEAAQAQREADAGWIQEQGLVRLPSEEERQQWLDRYEDYVDKYIVEDYDRWLRERG